jgi:hypothetical protein
MLHPASLYSTCISIDFLVTRLSDDLLKQFALSFSLLQYIPVFLFQILLCLAVHCTGVSILWCAMGGWIISERKRLKDTVDVELSRWRATSYRMEQAVVVLDVAFIIYYAIESAAITTVAHICAIILGATLSLLSIRLLNDDDGVTAQSTASSSPTTTLIDKRDS